MKHYKIWMPVMLAITLGLSVAAGTMKDMTISAESNDIDIEGIVGQYTLDEGEMAAVIYEVNKETGEMIDEEIEKQEEVNREAGTSSSISSRDWSRYSSSTAAMNFTSAEQAFYERCTNLAQYYMDNSTIDAYYVNSYGINAINGVKYSDLGLSSTQAFYVAQWFLYNNPQYYFLKPTFLTTSSAIYIACHDVAVDGDERANITNEIFDTVDYIVSEVQASSSNPYEMEKCIHDIVCGNLNYQSGQYDQSIYSALILGDTVCAGYAGTMTVLNNAVGIDTITSLSKVHAWNEVNLDGEWYGVDSTWDDSLGNYTFFAVSEENLKKYDGSSREHTVETSWVDWTPALADHDYGGAGTEQTLEEITLSVPELTIKMVDDDPTAFRVTWPQVDNASAYEFCVYNNADYTDAVITQTVKSGQVKLTKMNNGQTYWFTVRALRSVDDNVIYSDYAYGSYTCVIDEPESEPEPITVAVPTNVTVSDETTSSFRLSWTGVDNATSYRLELYRDEAYSDSITVGSTKKNSMKISGLKPGQSMYIKLFAVLTDDTGSYYSDAVCVKATALEETVQDEPSSNQSEDTSSTQPAQEETKPEPITVDVPGNFVTSDVTETTIRVIWDAVADSTYEIQVAKDSEFTNLLASGTTAKTKMNIKGLTEGTGYYFRVRAVKSVDGQVYYSEWNSISAMTNSEQIVVSIPSNVVCDDVSAYTAHLTWDAVASAKYNVSVKKYSVNANGGYDVVYDNQVTENSLALDNLDADTEYFVFVQAVVEHNGKQYTSDWSSIVFFKTDSDKIVVNTPENVAVNITADNVAKLTWNAPSNQTGLVTYEIEISKLSDFSSTIAKGKTAKQQMNIKGLSKNTTYYVRVRTIVTGVTINYSDWVDTEIFIEDNMVEVPANVSATSVDDTKTRISWIGSSDKYELMIYSDAAHTSKLAGMTTAKQSVKISGLKAGRTYYIAVRAVKGDNYSDWVNIHFTK